MPELRVRLATGPLDDWTKGALQAQVRDSAVETLGLTDAACEMLTSLAGIRGGRRRERLWEDLEDIVNGDLPGGDEEYTDDSTAAFGQMLGPLFAILRADSGGAWEVIRVLEEPAHETRPDFILVNRGNGSIAIHECKGVATDCDKVRMRGELDLCEAILGQYRKGRDKLTNGDLHPNRWKLRRRLTLVGDGQMLPFPTSKLLVSVTAISDGRLGALNPQPRHVPGCGLPCTYRCVAEGKNGIVIAALAEKVLVANDVVGDSPQPVPGYPQFPLLDAYKACERALWQGSGAAFGSAYAGLLSATRQAECDDSTITHSTDFLISPLEAAAAQGVAADMREALTTADRMRLPRSFVDALKYWAHRLPSERPEPPEEMDVSRLGQILGRHGEDLPNRPSSGEWVVRDSGDRHVHLRLIPSAAGQLVRLSPREPLPSPSEGARSMIDLSGSLLSATLRVEMPIRELFARQRISLSQAQDSAGEGRSFELGWSAFPGRRRGVWRDFLHQFLERGPLPGPWGRCPRGHPFMHEQLWWELMHDCARCGRDECLWPWFFPFSAWVSYDGRAEMRLPCWPSRRPA